MTISAYGNEAPVNSELVSFDESDAGFAAIRATELLVRSVADFDVFIRLGEARYIRFLAAGDGDCSERIGRYLERGVQLFYLRQLDLERYLALREQIVASATKTTTLASDTQARCALSQGEQILQLFQKQGISEENLSFARTFVDSVNTLIQRAPLGRSDTVKSFLANAAEYEHGAATSIVAAILGIPLGFTSNRSVEILGVASMLHDIGLSTLPKEIHDEDESKMSEDQKKSYQTHPMRGAEILKSIRGIDPVTLQAVAQHHERRNKRGFPNRLSTGAINRVAEIVGISGEFVSVLLRANRDPLLSPRREMEFRVFDGFSMQVVDAFRAAFFTPPKASSRSAYSARSTRANIAPPAGLRS